MKQPEFPLFEPRDRLDEERVVTDVFSTIVQEVERAAYVGRDEAAQEKVRFSVDVGEWLDRHLRALAIALGTSRRALAAKLLSGAILEAINTLEKEGQGDNAHVHFVAVRDTYLEALKELAE